jgi:hypothetical protein
MLATVQPFGLQSPSGGSRILRALLTDAPESFLSVCTARTAPPDTTLGREVHLPLRPHFGRLESTRFAPWLWHLAPLTARTFQQRLEASFREQEVRAVHAIPHGLDFWHAFTVARRLGLSYYLNCHDELDYNLKRRPDLPEAQRRLAEVWREADGRMVISEAMGQEYCRRYGGRPYEVVTDGLVSVPASPRPRPEKSLRVYFAGAVHLSYHANFSALAEALSRFATENLDWDVSLTIRGYPPELKATVPIRTLPWGTEEDVERDLATADLLYLPLPFAPEHASFSRYSMSTKMVTYLGSGVPILFHGPEESAAGRLLAAHGAAVALHSLDPTVMARDLRARVDGLEETVQGALHLARRQFLLTDQRQRFWEMVGTQAAATITVHRTPEVIANA